MNFLLAPFRADITPGLQTPLCGGLVQPAQRIDDPLWAVGFVLAMENGAEPIVQVALDWTALWNESYLQWQRTLADAAGTSRQRVLINCVHPHDAPMADMYAHRLLQQQRNFAMFDEIGFDQALQRTAAELREAMQRPRRVTHVGAGQARVEQVASNRRIIGPDGRFAHMRYSACHDAAARAAPEGLIDPWLKTITFFAGDEPVVALSAYTCHPMSHYGQGAVSCDFFGLARGLRQQETPGCLQMIVNGCLGDQGAGKYNDGSAADRIRLRDRVYRAMTIAAQATQREPLERVELITHALHLPYRDDPAFEEAALQRVLADPAEPPGKIVRAALGLSRLQRLAQGPPLELAAVRCNQMVRLVLPGEPFVTYQLAVQQRHPGKFVQVSAVADDSTAYICTDEAYGQGGYEPTSSMVGPVVQEQFGRALSALIDEACA